MSVGTLILLHLSTIPFIGEFEWVGTTHRRFPTLLEVIGLSHTRSERWFYGYLVFLAIIFGLAVVPSASGKVHAADTTLIAISMGIQFAVWLFAVLRVRKHINNGEGK